MIPVLVFRLTYGNHLIVRMEPKEAKQMIADWRAGKFRGQVLSGTCAALENARDLIDWAVKGDDIQLLHTANVAGAAVQQAGAGRAPWSPGNSGM